MKKLPTQNTTLELANDKIKRVYCLYRVSTKGQVDKNDIPLQKKSCRDFAEHQPGWIIRKEFQEKGISGFKISADDRDAVQELKKAAENKEFDILLVFMFDRIGRIDNETPFVVEWFINHGIEVWSVNEGQQKMESQVDKLMNYIRFWQANGESQKTSIRVKARLHQLVEEGVYTGGCAPFGYQLVKSGVINKKGKELLTLETVSDEVDIVKLIFDRTVKEGIGSYKMAEYINGMNVRTHSGAKFQANTIKRILSNPIYCGYYVRGGATSKRIEELQIIDDRVFDDAQKILEQRRCSNDQKVQLARSAKSSTMLGGNIYCAHCGKKLCANSFIDRYTTKDGVLHDGARRFRYLCSGKAMHRNKCDGQSVYSASKVDKVVIEALHHCFEKIKITPKDAAIEKRYKAQILEIRRDINKLEKETEVHRKKLKELSGYIADVLMGNSRFTEDTLAMAIDGVKQTIESNEHSIAEKQKQLNSKESDIKKLDYYYEQFLSWADEFDSASSERKRMIICTLFKEITVGREYKIEILMDSSYEQFIA